MINNITRAEVQDQIIKITQTLKNKEDVKIAMGLWLKDKCSEFDTKQILNDLTSYKEYLELT